MCRFLRWTAIVALNVCQAAVIAGDKESSAATTTLRYEPRFILETVARRMGVTLRPDIPTPTVFLESKTSLRQFQNAIAPQWRFRPQLIANSYAIARNEIYLGDGAAYYLRLRRSLDDSLAHELVHYIQAKYFNDDLASDSSEANAVAIQTWFRDVYVRSPEPVSVTPLP